MPRTSYGAGLLLAMAAASLLGFQSRTGAGAAAGGLLVKDGRALFPIGIYELPKDQAALAAAAEAGFNLVRCRSREDLDRAHAAGLLGWVPLPLDQGNGDELARLVNAVKDHPALAVWEAPDEFVWNFTAEWGRLMEKGVFQTQADWARQTPAAVEYSESEGARLIAKFLEGARLVRRLDGGRKPLWLNEAANSDVKFIRQLLDVLDIVGCDYYPIRSSGRAPQTIGAYTERYRLVGREKPVWMVLQGFSWSVFPRFERPVPAYPSFAETRMMAYDAIAHGAKGVLYYGTHTIPPDLAPFRESLDAMASELAALQPFLAAPPSPARLRLIEVDPPPPERIPVAVAARRAREDWLIVLVNDDPKPHFGVEIGGLQQLDGKTLELLYGSEKAVVSGGEFITRMMPLEVKVFATSRKWETSRRKGRDFPGR